MGKKDFIMIPTKLINDNSVTIACRAFIMYLMSYECEEGIDIEDHIKEESQHSKRKEIMAYVEEALKSGYVVKKEKDVNGLKTCVYYTCDEPV